MLDQEKLALMRVLVGTGFVFLMQARFLCIESGLTRPKYGIDVAVKILIEKLEKLYGERVV
jgi:Amt family ammonium transporter